MGISGPEKEKKSHFTIERNNALRKTIFKPKTINMLTVKALVSPEPLSFPTLLEFEEVTNIFIGNSAFNILSKKATPTAESYKMDVVTLGGELFSHYQIPVNTISNLATQTITFLPEKVSTKKLALPLPAETLCVEVPAGKKTVTTAVNELLELNRINKRCANKIIEIAEDQQIADLSEFMHNNDRNSITEYVGSGSGVVQALLVLAAANNLSASHI